MERAALHNFPVEGNLRPERVHELISWCAVTSRRGESCRTSGCLIDRVVVSIPADGKVFSTASKILGISGIVFTGGVHIFSATVLVKRLSNAILVA